MMARELRQAVQRGEGSSVQLEADVSGLDSHVSEFYAFLDAQGGLACIAESNVSETVRSDVVGARVINQTLSCVVFRRRRNPGIFLNSISRTTGLVHDGVDCRFWGAEGTFRTSSCRQTRGGMTGNAECR